MELREALTLPSLSGTHLVAGRSALDREVRWAHVVEIPDPFNWVADGYLLLSTGYAWPQSPGEQRAFVRNLADKGVVGVCLAIPKYLPTFPEAMLDTAEGCGLALLEFPWDVPFSQVTQEVHGSIVAEKYAIIERSARIHRAMTQAAIDTTSLSDLARVLGQLIGRSVAFEDEGGHLLGHYQLGAPDRIRQITLDSGRTSRDYLDWLEQMGLLRQIYSSLTTVTIPASAELGAAARMVCPIHMQGKRQGYVWIIEGDTRLTEQDRQAAEQAALVAGLHLARQRELALQEVRLGYAFLDSLIEGGFEGTAQALERSRLLGFDPARPYRVGIALLDEALPLSEPGFSRRERLSIALRNRLLDLGGPGLVSVSLNQIQMLIPPKVPAERLWEVIGSPGLTLLLGRDHHGPQGIRRSYHEALSLLPHARPGAVWRYEDFLIPRALSGEAEAHQALIDEVYGTLGRLKGGEMLRETLLAYTREGFHQLRTAQAMGLHLNTLRYRLGRVAEVLNLDLEDPQTRFKLELALHLLASTEGTGTPGA